MSEYLSITEKTRHPEKAYTMKRGPHSATTSGITFRPCKNEIYHQYLDRLG